MDDVPLFWDSDVLVEPFFLLLAFQGDAFYFSLTIFEIFVLNFDFIS